MQVQIVDVDDTTSWPDEVVGFIEEQSETADLESNPFMSAEDEILLNLLDSMYLLVYHATRLLPHEKDDIRTNGLQVLTGELVTRKIREAVRYEYLTEEIGEELRCGSTLRTQPEEKRANKICFVLGKSPFEKEHSGLSNLFDIWGGESINYTDAGDKYMSCLKKIGEPAVVKALLPITAHSSVHIYPALTSAFIMTFRGENPSGELQLENESIPPKCILDILRPEGMANRK